MALTATDLMIVSHALYDYVDEHENDNKGGTSWMERHATVMHLMHCVAAALEVTAEKMDARETP